MSTRTAAQTCLDAINVIHSLMPKGVEHFRSVMFSASFRRVIHSLMPKGVEHAGALATAMAGATVIHSLMPKGVEHSQTVGRLSGKIE